MSSIIHNLQSSQLIWHASHLAADPNTQVSSGFAVLDQKLGGGWPDKGIIQLQSENIGIGEVRLLLPGLKQLRHNEKLYFWVNPPGRLNGQTLETAGLPLSHTLIAKDVNQKEAFWLAEKSLRSGCCVAVILWCESITPTQAKRLQLAAKEGNSLGFIIHPPLDVEQSLPVSVRMSIAIEPQGLHIDIHKRLGGYPVSPFTLDMSKHWPQLARHDETQPGKSSATDNSEANHTVGNVVDMAARRRSKP